MRASLVTVYSLSIAQVQPLHLHEVMGRAPRRPKTVNWLPLSSTARSRSRPLRARWPALGLVRRDQFGLGSGLKPHSPRYGRGMSVAAPAARSCRRPHRRRRSHSSSRPSPHSVIHAAPGIEESRRAGVLGPLDVDDREPLLARRDIGVRAGDVNIARVGNGDAAFISRMPDVGDVEVFSPSASQTNA